MSLISTYDVNSNAQTPLSQLFVYISHVYYQVRNKSTIRADGA